jgi:hypothetical protein
MSPDSSAAPLPEAAYYYPEPYWGLGGGDWMKTLLLFFDEIVILLPRYMTGRPEAADPVLAGPLREQGLLRILEPEVFVDRAVTESLASAMVELLTTGAFDDLPREAHATLGPAIHPVVALDGGDGVADALLRAITFLLLGRRSRT